MRSVVLGRSTSRGVPGGQPGYFSTGWFLFSLFQKRSSVLKNSFVPFCESYSETENPLYGCFGAVLVLVWACSGPSIGPTPTFSTGSNVFGTRPFCPPQFPRIGISGSSVSGNVVHRKLGFRENLIHRKPNAASSRSYAGVADRG